MLKIKLFAVLAFLAFAGVAFLFSGSRTGAQEETGKTDEKRAAVLEKIASYKQWRELKKPDKKTDEPELILNSTAMG